MIHWWLSPSRVRKRGIQATLSRFTHTAERTAAMAHWVLSLSSFEETEKTSQRHAALRERTRVMRRWLVSPHLLARNAEESKLFLGSFALGSLPPSNRSYPKHNIPDGTHNGSQHTGYHVNGESAPE